MEQVIAQAQAAGDADTVNHLTSRLEGFRQICAEAAQTEEPPGPALPPDLRARLDAATLQAALENDPALADDLRAFVDTGAEAIADVTTQALFAAFIAVEHSEQMVEFWRSVPAGWEEPFMQSVEEEIAAAEAEGAGDRAAALRARLEGFRQVHATAQAADEMPPTLRAATAFFAEERALLQPYEAQQALDRLAEQLPPDTPAEMRTRIAARCDLLRRLRGAAPTSTPLADAHGSEDPPLAPRNSQIAPPRQSLPGAGAAFPIRQRRPRRGGDGG